MSDERGLTLSKFEYGARHGVGYTAVHNWIARGLIAGDALTPNGRINVTEADRQLAINRDASRAPSPTSTRDEIQKVELELRTRRLKAEDGVYIKTDDVRHEVARGFEQFVAAADNWVNDVAGELGLDA